MSDGLNPGRKALNINLGSILVLKTKEGINLVEEHNKEISRTDHISRISISHQQLTGFSFPKNKKHEMEEEKQRNAEGYKRCAF
jgi:regulatory protein YycI of two-component signal transduction system YycFG